MIFTYWTSSEHTEPPSSAAWRTSYPSFRIFGDNDVRPLLGVARCDLYDRITLPACKSDVARIVLLHQYGGLYVDAHAGPTQGERMAETLDALSSFELILFCRAYLKQTAEELHLMNGAIAGRQSSELLDRLLDAAFDNLAGQDAAEASTPHHVGYDLWGIAGTWIFLKCFFDVSILPSTLRSDLSERVLVRHLSTADEPGFAVYKSHGYRQPGRHWSERQKLERLFIRPPAPQTGDTSMMPITLLQTCDPDVYLPMMRETSRTVAAYRDRLGCQSQQFVGIHHGFHPWHANYNRIFMLARLMEQHVHGWAIYLDADCYINDLSFDLRLYLADKPTYWAIMSPGGGQEPWNINNGVMLVNLDHPLTGSLIDAWKAMILGVSDKVMATGAVWYQDGLPGSQGMLHQLMRSTPDLCDRLLLADHTFINSSYATFIRHLLRVDEPDLAQRIARLSEEVAEVLARQDTGAKTHDIQYIINRQADVKQQAREVSRTMDNMVHATGDQAEALRQAGSEAFFMLYNLAFTMKPLFMVRGDILIRDRVHQTIECLKEACLMRLPNVAGDSAQSGATRYGMVLIHSEDEPFAADEKPWTFGRRKQSGAGSLIPDLFFLSSHGYDGLREQVRSYGKPWSDRKPTFFWRGSTTGGDDRLNAANLLNHPRVRLCRQGMEIGAHMDLAITAVVTQETAMEAEAIEKLLKAMNLWSEIVPKMVMLEYRFQFDIDGNANSWSLYEKLLMGACVLKVESQWEQWYYDDLWPWTHYVPVAKDLSDLHERVAWCLDNDSKCADIAAAGQTLASNRTYTTEVQKMLAMLAEHCSPEEARTSEHMLTFHQRGGIMSLFGLTDKEFQSIYTCLQDPSGVDAFSLLDASNHSGLDPAEDTTAEFRSLIYSAYTAATNYQMIVLGAAPGEWPTRAERAFRKRHPTGTFTSYCLEADPDHFLMLQKFLAANGASSSDHILMNSAVAAIDGYAYFPVINPETDWGAGIVAASSSPRDLDQKITMSEQSRAERISANGGKPLKFRTVQAVSLATLIERVGLIDYIHSDIQGAELEVFPPALQALTKGVRICCVSTHENDIEATLKAVFAEYGWKLECAYPCQPNRDGTFVWSNPSLLSTT